MSNSGKNSKTTLMIMFVLILGVLATAVSAAPQAVTVDGILDNPTEGYNLAKLQDTPTQFGDNSDATIPSANGSELDAAYITADATNLYIMLTGNLQTNFNKLEIFIDSVSGGQNKLRGDNPDVDFNGLNRMGDDGSNNGLRFDTGFESDYYLTFTTGDPGGGIQVYGNFAPTNTAGGGTGTFLGQGAPGTTINGALGIDFAINNSNTGGVDGSNVNDPSTVTTGIEIKIPWTVIGTPGGNILAAAFINGGGHDFVSNQVLGGVNGAGNPGEPRNVDFNTISNNQYFGFTPTAVTLNQIEAVQGNTSMLITYSFIALLSLCLPIIFGKRRQSN